MSGPNEAVTKYLDAVGTSFELMAAAGTKASERSARVSKKFAEQTLASQREALSFAKKLAEDPDHMMSASYSSLTESTVQAQTRAISFAQLVYQEALESSAEGRELSEQMVEANKVTAEAATELSRAWASMNPLTEFVMRTAETGMEAATGKKGK